MEDDTKSLIQGKTLKILRLSQDPTTKTLLMFSREEKTNSQNPFSRGIDL